MGIHPSRKALVALFAMAVALTGGVSRASAQSGSRTHITRAELAELEGEELDGQQAVERLRSLWLRDGPVVYADGARTTLDRYQADEIEEMEFLDPQQAELRFGRGHEGGAILVTTRVGGNSGQDLLNQLLADAGGGSTVEQGEAPRETDNTKAAGDHLDAGDDADTPEEARSHYQMALTAAQAAIAEDPRNPLAYRLSALANLQLGNYAQAGANFEQAKELRPLYEFQDAGIREGTYIEQYQLASPLIQQGAYEQAAEYLENADAVYGNGRPEAKVTLAQIYAALGDDELALEKMDGVVAFLASDAMDNVDEETATNWRNQAAGFPLMRAQVLADAGRYEEAVPAYRDLIAANPDDITLRQDLGAILMQMGETDQALEVYAELLDRPGLNSDALTRIGLGFYQAEQYDQAARALEQAADASPMDRDAIEWWARALLADSATAEIPDVADRWIALDPQSQQAYAMLAQSANAIGETPRAAAAVEKVQGLEFSVDDLTLRRGMNGGADVTGAVQNKTLAEGTSVTLVFTFYSESGDAMGTVEQAVQVGAEGMNQLFQLHFDSTEMVGGYGYTVGG